ncbi:MAG: polysaccharide deacetylase family protein [Promethearchaeota archaeon]
MIGKIISKSSFYQIRDVILFILDKFGINEIFRLKNKDKYIILWYHGISKRYISYSKRHVAVFEFEREIKYLKRKNYIFINLTDLNLVTKLKKREKFNQRYVIITFDDGFINVIKNAYPIMEKYVAKGILYLVTDVIDKNQLLWTDFIEVLIRNSFNLKFKFIYNDELIYYNLNSENDVQKACKDIKEKLRKVDNTKRLELLKQFGIPNTLSSFKSIPQEYLIVNWSDIKRLNKKILEIGCHTKTHPNLKRLRSDLEFDQELKDSKDIIESKIGYEIKHFCYPGGAFNDNVIQYIKKFNYKTATTTLDGLNDKKTDLFKLKRLQMQNNYIVFKCKVSGFYSYIKKYLYNYSNLLRKI